MASTVFDKVLEQARKRGYGPKQSRMAASWFRDKTTQIRSGYSPATLMKESSRITSRPEIGKMYHFYYSPKMAVELPYYDTFPLVFPIKTLPDGFLGINMHYLYPSYRAKLMDALYDVASNKMFNESTKLIVSYKILNGVSKYEYFKPCLKHYLAGNIRSRFLRIESAEWNIALFLPTEQFQKKTREAAWLDSKRSLK